MNSILLLVDGHRMNDNLHGSALIGTEAMLDVDLIEQDGCNVRVKLTYKF